MLRLQSDTTFQSFSNLHRTTISITSSLTMSTDKKIILVAGASSGIGLACCQALAKHQNLHIIASGRNQQRVDEAVTKIKEEASSTTIVEGGIVDLASLKSVRNFADQLIERDLKLYTLVANAGMAASEKKLTEDGFETTIATNHIGHFLLVTSLQDRTKRIVMLTSETHDPAEKAGPPPNVSNLDQLAVGYEKFDISETYVTSKLCNLLFTAEFARRYPYGPEIVAYTPGFVPATSLSRDMVKNRTLWKFISFIIRMVIWFRGGRVSTPEHSGGFLARIAYEEPWNKNGWKNGDYFRVDEVRAPSKLARDPALAELLWEKTEGWVKPFKN